MTETLSLLIQSGNPLIAIETPDEDRALEVVRPVATELRRNLYQWSLTRGLWEDQPKQGEPARLLVPGGKVPPVLDYVRQSSVKDVFLLKDLGPHCRDAYINRMLRDLLAVCGETKSTLILVDASPLPPEVKRFAVYYELAWPTTEELEHVVRETYQRIRDESLYEIRSHITKSEMEQLIQTLRGLSCSEAARVVASAIYADYDLTGEDLPRIVEAKRMLLGSTGCLETIAADFSPDEIGGLNNLRSWLEQRRGGFTQKARQFGLDPPRGVLMLGVQGCGKSLCAKFVAADWKMPLLRLDPGVLYQKFIGESESRLREALSQAEAMAPVVLWIDEIEKAFASASGDSSDGGLSQRMFGTMLSWMQDHRHPIFIVATANDISKLPPELMRKGRFDEVFFVDLPADKARQRIFEIHLARRKRNPQAFNLPMLSEATDGFSGAEIEQAIVSAMFAAFSTNSEVGDEHLMSEINKTSPLSVMMAERVASLRSWAANRCVPAD